MLQIGIAFCFMLAGARDDINDKLIMEVPISHRLSLLHIVYSAMQQTMLPISPPFNDGTQVIHAATIIHCNDF